LIRFILRAVRNDPVRLVVFTAVLAGLVSLDGDGSTTFIITVSALLPIYLKLGMSPVVLTVVANLANGVLNILPWGGPTVRAATVLDVSPSELFNPMVPGMVLGILTVVVLAYFLSVGAPPPAGLGTHAGAGSGVAVCQVGAPGAGACGVGGSAGTGPVGDGDERPVDDAAHADIVSSLDPNRPTLRPADLVQPRLTVAL
jgi:CitMHS family citrate-Mg2+:H+ or citrate-Ca2+:H+ symporter